MSQPVQSSQSLIAFDTDHIKSYVFGTNRLKEIRGASSMLDRLNRDETVSIARKYQARTIYAHGGSALFIVDTTKALQLGQEVQKLYHEKTGGGASITYAIQPIPEYGEQDIMVAETLSGGVLMKDVLNLLRTRLRLAKDSLHLETSYSEPLTHITLPTHALLSPCTSCGVAYAEDQDKYDDDGSLYCRVCLGKREEDHFIKDKLSRSRKTKLPYTTLWGRIQRSLGDEYLLSDSVTYPERPEDFNVFRNFTHGKEYLGLIYADANSMGKALQELPTLNAVEKFAETVDEAVFEAMGKAIRTHLLLQHNTFPFDILLVGGDDIVMVTPADKAMQVAQMLASTFREITKEYTLSIGVVLAPVKYPFALQNKLVDETLRAAKTSGARRSTGSASNTNTSEETRINFVAVTGNTSLGYEKQYSEMHREKTLTYKNEFYATLRPYTLADFEWLLQQVQKGNKQRLGRTKLHQLREAILKLNRTTTIVDALALLRNWNPQDRDFIKEMVQHFDDKQRKTPRQEALGPLFPWYLDGNASSESESVYRTPLLDFIELYDFVLA